MSGHYGNIVPLMEMEVFSRKSSRSLWIVPGCLKAMPEFFLSVVPPNHTLMNSLGILFGSLLITTATAVSSASILDISPAQWHALNISVGGRLHAATPFALPCFSKYNNISVSVNEAECSAIQANYTSANFRIESFSANMKVEYETCMSTHSGCLLDSANPRNPLATDGIACSQGEISPFYIDVRMPNDIQAAFEFSKGTGVPLSIKNTGHDYMGRSRRRDSLGIWTHNLQTMTYHPQFVPELCASSHRAITVGAGVTFEQVYKFADDNDSMFIGGYAQTIGASGGWMMGGGHSVLTPSFGLGVDRVLEIKIVTPDGILRTANTCQNSDLFWALRGGGGGTFGVVVESTHLVEERIPIQVINMTFTPTNTNLQEYFEVLVNNSAHWGEEGWGGHVNHAPAGLIYVNPRLSLMQAKASMAQLFAFAQANNGIAVIETLPSWFTFFTRFIVAVESAVGNSAVLFSRLIPKALFESAAGRTQLVAHLLKQTSEFGMPYIPVATPIAFNYTPGATSVTPAWRTALWHVSFPFRLGFPVSKNIKALIGDVMQLGGSANWSYSSSTAEIRAVLSTIHDFVHDDLTALAPDSGAYMNEGDVYESNHESDTYWGTNYERLLAVKTKYDPHGLLDCWRCVGWTGAAQFPCYPDLS
ncbi:FAD-binding domain-containing protein [Mycena venus]|uniref:FAD-binding domain-containing protein n=1 Tax=Mycena venus TaxID=2733690 RepID=A0A8H6XLI5_9AGAR|nr:FAD-binding domain-containing protein [Mycena venus]